MNLRLDSRADESFVAALKAERGGSARPAALPTPVVRRLPSHPPLRDGEVLLGVADAGGDIGIDLAKLVEGRLLIQGASRTGKSWTLRRLLEQTFGRLQQIIIDPEGEFRSIAERYGHVAVDAGRLDAAALRQMGLRAREHRLSLWIDLSELGREAQMVAVAAVLSALVEAPREHWSPCLVAIDEAHLFAPLGGQSGAPDIRKNSIGAMVDLMSRGAKRGLCGMLATQRLARLAKSVASEVHSFLIGMNTLDLDIRRAAETIGWDARRAFDRLPMLSPGDFVAVGPAFSRSPSVLRVGSVETFHRGATPALQAPADHAPGAAAALLGLEALIEESERDAEIRDDLVPGLKAVRQFIRDPAFALAGRTFEALRPLAPEGARIADLAAHFAASRADVAAGIALLDRFGAVETMGDGEAMAARIVKGMEGAP